MESSCPTCGNPVVEIHLADVMLRSCSTCDTRWWLRADTPAGIEDVLRSFSEAPGGRRRRRTADAAR